MSRVSILMLCVTACAFLGGCVSEPYANNSANNTLYRLLNNNTTYKERVLFFEMQNYGNLVSEGKFYINGVGVSSPGVYNCSEDENILSAINKAGQVSSYDQLSFTLVRGIRKDEREISGLVLASGNSPVLDIRPGDLLEIKAMPARLALSHE